MILCPSCNRENDNDAKACVNCGEALLQYNSLCGMPVLGGSSRGQVLAMRYTIERQLSEDDTGCTYEAEDGADNTTILIKALPLSVSLSSRQVELLKESAEIITSLSHPNINGFKAFGTHGKVRYFVYEYSEQQKQENSELVEKIKENARQLDRAQWKVGALSAEIERLLRKNRKKKTVTIETSPASRLKFAIMTCIFALVLVAVSVFGTYSYINFEKTDENLLRHWMSVLHISKQPDNKTAIALSTLNSENKIAAHDAKEATKETRKKTGLPEPAKLTTDLKPPEEPPGNEKLPVKTAQEKKSDTIFELGLMYYTGKDVKQNYNKALDYFLESAQAGNKTAMYDAGRMYHQGSGTEVNDIMALKWYRKAAEGGLTKAMNQLAQMYYFGDTVKQDRKKAAEYYERSAEKGDLKAMYNLALLYHSGAGVEKDTRKAMLWFIKAARKGDPDSMYQLGVMFDSGISIEKNLKKAHYWYQAAAKAGQREAKKQLAKLGQSL